MRSLFSTPPALGLNGRFRSQSNAMRLVSGWIERRRGRRVLARLDTHLLRDIGMTAQEVSSEIAKPFWRD